jgi:hypothetical protein
MPRKPQPATLELPVRRAQAEQVCVREAGMLQHHFGLRLSLTLLQKLEKTIPDAPKGETPVHLRTRNIFATH